MHQMLLGCVGAKEVLLAQGLSELQSRLPTSKKKRTPFLLKQHIPGQIVTFGHDQHGA